MPVVKKSFTGGINSDDASYLLDPKEYLGAINVRFITSESGQVGNAMPVEGTVLKAQTTNSIGTTIPFVLPAGTNQVIGATEDAPKRRAIWAVWNSNGNHAIYCYDYDTDRVYNVLKSADVVGGLNFQQNKFIHSCSVVYGIFYWTDDYSQPRRINIEAGIKTNHPTFVTTQSVYTTPIDQSVITVIRPQPIRPMTVAYVVDTNLKLISDGYQGAYRFGYRDKEYSTFSSFSRSSSPTVGVSVFTGYLTFTIPLTQKIAQDVDKIEAAVKFPGSKLFIQKTWTRANDAAAIAAHNAGTTALSFNFYADSIGVAVDDATAFKAYDNVPLLASTMEVSKDRLFLANTLTGYDTPESGPLGWGTTLGPAIPVLVNGARASKSGSTYKFGLVYYDEFGRSSGVVAGPTLTIPSRGGNASGGSWYGNSTWTFLNTGSVIPLWAKYYSIVRTKAKKCTTFFQFKPNEFKYVTKDSAGQFVFSATPPANVADIYGLGLRAAELYNIGYGYAYTEGDIAEVEDNVNGTFKLNVINQYSDFIIVEYKSLLTNPTVAEIYTPSPSGTVEYYYEVGNRYEVTNPGTPSRAFSVVSDSIYGDVYIKARTSGANTYYFEVMNMVDTNWQGWYTDAGRGMTEIFAKVTRQPTSICFSEPFTLGVNGLSTFNALDYSILPEELDSIQKIINTSKTESQGSVLLVIGEQETLAQYIGESQIFDNAGSSFLAKSSGVLGNFNMLKGSFGTLHPESVFKWKDEVVYFDVNKGSVVKYSVNGLFPISDNKMRQYWRKTAQDIREYYRDQTVYNTLNPNMPFKVLGMADPFNEEYLMYTPRLSAPAESGYLQDILNSCTNYVYQFPEGATSMSYNLPLVPGTMYYIDTLWRETNISYNGVLLNNNPYFVAVSGVNSILIESNTQFGGEFTLCDCMQSYYDPYDGKGGVVSYSPLLDKWVTKYSFIPEWMVNVSNRLVSFKNGNIYIHSGAYNSFYGVNYDSILVGVLSEAGNTIKVYDSVAVEGDTPYMVHFRTEIPNVQSTNVLSNEFTIKEGVKYAAILRDRLSPNVTGTYDQKMYKGDSMRGEVCKFMVIYRPVGNKTEMKFININFTPSTGQTV